MSSRSSHTGCLPSLWCSIIAEHPIISLCCSMTTASRGSALRKIRFVKMSCVPQGSGAQVQAVDD
eukprot:1109671-Rhodomonas_salina.2